MGWRTPSSKYCAICASESTLPIVSSLAYASARSDRRSSTTCSAARPLWRRSCRRAREEGARNTSHPGSAKRLLGETMPRARCTLLVSAVATALVSLHASGGPDAERRFRAVDSGIALDLTVRQLHPDKAQQPFREGDEVAVTLSVSDATSGKPIAGVFPTAWMSRQRREPAAADLARCRATVARFVSGGLLSRPDVDLNVYHVLALNTDPTITVVDPHFSFGGSQLLALVSLQSPGEDWAL